MKKGLRKQSKTISPSLAELVVLRIIKRVSCIDILFIYKAYIEIGAGLNRTDLPPFATEYLKTKRNYKSCNRRSSSLRCTTLGNLSNLDILSNSKGASIRLLTVLALDNATKVAYIYHSLI